MRMIGCRNDGPLSYIIIFIEEWCCFALVSWLRLKQKMNKSFEIRTSEIKSNHVCSYFKNTLELDLKEKSYLNKIFKRIIVSSAILFQINFLTSW